MIPAAPTNFDWSISVIIFLHVPCSATLIPMDDLKRRVPVPFLDIRISILRRKIFEIVSTRDDDRSFKMEAGGGRYKK
ncbi:hypothetical protein B9Z19DRAFT_1073700 [Tuber borchii]|uniref:Uncharacterized protein n=1 Tax=Tuber borchii TaxID=42251 RepID=A0A2T7A5L6_TUBBO|nr:hypothetical protein B9Z19DRAFT_1073700 [Tuber borchii]